jgi:WD40 repeat protein
MTPRLVANRSCPKTYFFSRSIYQAKTFDLLNSFTAHTGPVTGVRFGQHARTVVSASLDRSLKVYA